MLDSSFPVDMSEVKKLIDTSDVLLIRFTTVQKRLLLDFRYTSLGDGRGVEVAPMVTLVDRAPSTEQRFRELKQLRPHLPMPDHIMSFRWPRKVSSLDDAGIVDWLVQRLSREGYSEVGKDCLDLLHQLRRAEENELVAAIKGDGYHTIWERQA
ncbi:MAG: hypothetical protein HW403_571 [Dehalococcoidia bacterium]|nr:hypothetical protein [Dehalococcoidia bacterium]